MPSQTSARLVLVTAPDRATARRLARAALDARLIACANLVPHIESIYHWQGKVESGRELLMLLKTSRPKLKALERLILSLHPYDTAEFLVLPIESGARKYLTWITANLRRGQT